MGDAAYEPIGGIGDGEPSPMLFAPPPPAAPAKTKGESYVPPPPPLPGSEISKQSQFESNIGVKSGVGDASDGDFIQSAKTTHGGIDQMGYPADKKKKRKKSFASRCCMASACLVMLIGLTASIFMTMVVLGVIKL